MLMFISVGLMNISIGLSETHQYESVLKMFILSFKSLTYLLKPSTKVHRVAPYDCCQFIENNNLVLPEVIDC